MATLETFPVKVEGIDSRISKNILKEAFVKFGDIFSVNIMPLKKGLTTTLGYVNFTDRSDAEVAAMKMNNVRLDGCLLKTSIKETPISPRPDYRALTDCKYMLSIQGCVPQDGKPCPYRHRISSTGKACNAWIQGHCTNKTCPDLHPAHEKTEAKPTQETNQFEEICKCSLCLERLYLPKMLNCQHNYCKECLEDLVKFKGDPRRAVIECPVCREEHVLSDHQVIKDLPENLILKQNLDALGSKSSSDEPVCIDCKAVVTTYCGHHDVFLCDNCKNEHIMVKGCDVFHSVKYSRSKECIAPYCQEHDCFQNYGCYGLHCKTIPVCVFCAEYKHSGHKVILFNELAHKFESPVKDILSDIKDDEKIHEKLSQNASTALSASKKELKMMKKTLESWKVETLSKVVLYLKESEKQILDHFQSAKNEACKELNEIKQGSNKALVNFKQAREKVEQLFQRSNIEVFYQAENTCQEMKQILNENKPAEEVHFPVFKIEIEKGDKDRELYEALQSTFGAVKLSRYEEGDIQEIIFGQQHIDSSTLDVGVLVEAKPEDVIVKALADMKITLPEKNDSKNVVVEKNKKNKKKKNKQEDKEGNVNTTNDEVTSDNTCDMKKVEDEKPNQFFEVPGEVEEEENYFSVSEAPENEEENYAGADEHGEWSEDSDTCSVSSNSSNNPSDVSANPKHRNRVRGRGGRGRGRGKANAFGRGGTQSFRGRGQANAVGIGGTQSFRGRGQANAVGRGGTQSFRGGKNSGSHFNLPQPFPFAPPLMARPVYSTLEFGNFQSSKPVGSHQRPSKAQSFTNLRSLNNDNAPSVITCYRCGRKGHPVQNCHAKNTMDGRPLT